MLVIQEQTELGTWCCSHAVNAFVDGKKRGMVAYHDGEASTALGDNLVSLVGQIGNANR